MVIHFKKIYVMKMKTNKLKYSKTTQLNFLSGLKFLNWQITPLIIFLVFVSVGGCKSEGENEEKKKPKSAKLPLVNIQPAQKGKMVSYIDITGTIEANILTNIKSPADGIVKSLAARENQHVKNDKVIAVINPVDRVALISENQMKIEQLQKALDKEEPDTDEYKRLTRELDTARENLEYAKNMYKTIPVICPMNGVVTDRYVDKGSRVSAQDKMFTITDMSSLVIKTQVNEKYFEALEEGETLPVILNAYPNDTLSGQISLIYPQVDPVTRSVKFDIKILNFYKKLLPGMMASIKIPVSEKENAISVPNRAILTSPENKKFIFLVDSNNIAHRRVVKKGINSNNKVEILNGLKEGEKVVVDGQGRLKDSMKVKLIE